MSDAPRCPARTTAWPRAFRARRGRSCSSATTRSAPHPARPRCGHRPPPSFATTPRRRRHDLQLFDTRRGELVRDLVSFGARSSTAPVASPPNDAADHARKRRSAAPPGLRAQARLQRPRTTDAGGPGRPGPLTAMGRVAHEAVATDPEPATSTRRDAATRAASTAPPGRPARPDPGRHPRMLAVGGQDGYSGVTRPDRRRQPPRPLGHHREPDPDLEADPPPRSRSRVCPRAPHLQPARGHWYDPSSQGFFSPPPAAAMPATARSGTTLPATEMLTLFLRIARRLGARLPDNLLVTPPAASSVRRRRQRRRRRHTTPCPGITDVNRVIGLSRRGDAFEFAVNVLNDSEFAAPASRTTAARCSSTCFGDGGRRRQRDDVCRHRPVAPRRPLTTADPDVRNPVGPAPPARRAGGAGRRPVRSRSASQT